MMNKITLEYLKILAEEKGYQLKFDNDSYNIFKLVNKVNSLSDVETFLAVMIPINLTSPPNLAPLEADYDLWRVWHHVLSNISVKPKRELIRQMCRLTRFDGSSAALECKPAWYHKIMADLPIINAAFETTFGRAIAVGISKITILPPSPAPPSYDNKVPPPKRIELPGTKTVTILSSGKYRIRILDEIINQGYPTLDGQKYVDVLSKIEMAKILDFYHLSEGINLSIAIPSNSDQSWFLNFRVISLSIEFFKNTNHLLVTLQPIPRLTSSDHYLSIAP